MAGARRRGLPVLGELELAWRMLANEFIAVTGTNGKTTTVELIGHVHREAGCRSRSPATSARRPARSSARSSRRATVVCEASSFQLEDTVEFAPEAAVLLNVAPDHLDRHGTLRPTCAAKLEIFARQGNDDIAVAPLELGRRGSRRLRAARVLRQRPGRRAVAARRASCGGDERPLLGRRRDPPARARTTCTTRWPPRRCAWRGASRRGRARWAAHVRRRRPSPGGGRQPRRSLYVNDSKATNVASTLVALDALRRRARAT